MALVQGAGGTLNGTTWLDRTNYFETLPSHQLELAIWLEADRMGTLLEALSQENLDNQREVVKNEKRWSYDNRPYGTWNEKILGHLFPEEHPYHHPTIGSMEDLDAASLDDVKAFFATYYAPEQRRAERRGRLRPGDGARARREVLRPDPGQPGHPAAARHVAAGDHRHRDPRDGRGQGAAAARVHRVPRAGVRRHAPRCARPRRPAARGRQGQPPPPAARARRAPRPGRRGVHAPVHRRGVGVHRLGDRPAGRRHRDRRGGLSRGAGEARVGGPDRGRARPGEGAHRGRRAGLARAGRGASRPPVDVRDAVRRPRAHQHPAAALPVGHGRADPRRGARRVPRRQPGRAHLCPAGRRHGTRRRRHDRDRAHRGPARPGRAATLRLPVHRALRARRTASG